MKNSLAAVTLSVPGESCLCPACICDQGGAIVRLTSSGRAIPTFCTMDTQRQAISLPFPVIGSSSWTGGQHARHRARHC